MSAEALPQMIKYNASQTPSWFTGGIAPWLLGDRLPWLHPHNRHTATSPCLLMLATIRARTRWRQLRAHSSLDKGTRDTGFDDKLVIDQERSAYDIYICTLCL